VLIPFLPSISFTRTFWGIWIWDSITFVFIANFFYKIKNGIILKNRELIKYCIKEI
jgi:hypothetical protein